MIGSSNNDHQCFGFQRHIEQRREIIKNGVDGLSPFNGDSSSSSKSNNNNGNNNNNINYGSTVCTNSDRNEFKLLSQEIPHSNEYQNDDEEEGGEEVTSITLIDSTDEGTVVLENTKPRYYKPTSYTTLFHISCIGLVIYCFCGGVGFGLVHRQSSSSSSSSSGGDIVVSTTAMHHDEYNPNPTGAMFNFDTLFRGIKKKTSEDSLQKPPSTARSILLVLHAEAIPENPTVINDMDRQLTPKGERDAEGLGIYLKEHGIPEPDWIFSSPSERTAFTAEMIRRNWGQNAPVAYEEILYTLAFNDYFAFVAGLNFNFRRVMIIGHNPGILNTAKKLMKTHGIEDFPLCGFIEIRWDDLNEWMTVAPFTGNSKMAVDPNNNFFFSSK